MAATFRFSVLLMQPFGRKFCYRFALQGKMTKNNYYFPKDSIHKVTLCESFNSHFNRDPHNGEFCISEKVPSTDFSHVQVGHVKFTASTDRTLLGLKETSV